jgi:hypothetical protein
MGITLSISMPVGRREEEEEEEEKMWDMIQLSLEEGKGNGDRTR